MNGRERERRRALREEWLSAPAPPRCIYCNRALTADTITVEHIVPVSRGGRTNKQNCKPACRACNRARGNGESHFEQLIAQREIARLCAARAR